MYNLASIEERIMSIFLEFPELKKLQNKKRLIWYYWTKYEDLGDRMSYQTFSQLTDQETINRARRKMLENKKEKDPASVLMSMAVRKYYAN